jgi:hypothetical protein
MDMSNDPAKHGGSFIVRIWWERGDDGQAGGHWRGWVQHVRNGHQAYFTTLRDLNAFIEGETGIDRADDPTIRGLM